MNISRKLGCLIFILALSLPCFARKKIDLDGEWGHKIKSIFSELPVQAWVEDSNKDLLLEFSVDLGMVKVTVTNQAGEVVYNQFVKANVMSTMLISLDEKVRNGYALAITNSENCICGYINL